MGPADLVDAVQPFDLGAVVDAPQLVARGAMGEVYRLDTTRGSYAIKRLFDWNPGDGADREAGFTAVARDRGVSTPVEIPDRSGAYVANTLVGRVRAFTWIDVGPATTTPRALTLLKQFGAVMGLLHSIASEAVDAIDAWYLRPPADDGWDELIDAVGRTDVPWADALATSRDSIALATELATSAVVRSPRVCHRDLDPTNVLPDKDGRLVVFDWENLGALPPDREVAVALFGWTNSGPQQAGQIRAIREGYRAGGGIVEELQPDSFATLCATNLNHLRGQLDALLDPLSTPSDREYAQSTIPKLIPQPGDMDRIHELAERWNRR